MSLLLLDSPDTPATPRSTSVYAGMLRMLLPPGRLWAGLRSLLDGLLLGSSEEMVRLDARGRDLLRESRPSTTVELLPEYEAELEIEVVPGASFDERRAVVVTRNTADSGFRPEDFRQALAALLGQAPADVVVIERSRAFVVAAGDDRLIFEFFIYRDPALPGTPFLAAAQLLVNDMKPTHTRGLVIESVLFQCDDDNSQCDRDLVGA
jgi:uncharacterized protein YmfQ (DUF2313 family)